MDEFLPIRPVPQTNVVAGRAMIGLTAVGNGAAEAAHDTPDHKKPRPNRTSGAGSAYKNRETNPLSGFCQTPPAILAIDSPGKGNAMGLIAALLLAGGTPGLDGRWWYLFADDDRAWFADIASLIVDKDSTEFSYRQVFRTPDNGAAYKIVRAHYDCAKRQGRTISIVTYRPNGEAISERSTEAAGATPYSIVPDSNAETLFQFACAPPTSWPSLGFIAAKREPERVTRDFYVLIGYGLPDDDAAELACMDAKTELAGISHFIDTRVRRDIRNKLREAYGLRPDNIS